MLATVVYWLHQVFTAYNDFLICANCYLNFVRSGWFYSCIDRLLVASIVYYLQRLLLFNCIDCLLPVHVLASIALLFKLNFTACNESRLACITA